MKVIKQSSALEGAPAFDTAHTIKAVDPELWCAVERENRRQHNHIELIASENYVSPAVMRAQGSATNQQEAPPSKPPADIIDRLSTEADQSCQMAIRRGHRRSHGERHESVPASGLKSATS